MLEKERKLLGCYNSYNEPIHETSDLRYTRCIGNFNSDSASSWIESSDFFEKGIMPFQGGYMEQPAKVIEVMRIIRSFKLQWEVDIAQRKKAQSKARQAHGR